MRFKFILLLFYIFLFQSCASVKTVPLAQLPTVDAQTALIYFFREKKFSGSLVSFYVYEGEKKIGALKNGSFFFIKAKPGGHIYTAKTESKDTVTLKVEAGKTYYVKAKIGMGFFVGRPHVHPVSEIEGEAMIKKLKYAEPREVRTYRGK